MPFFSGLRYRLGLGARPLIVVAKSLAAAHVLLEVVGSPLPCEGLSMLPTLNPEGDFLIISPLPYWRFKWFFGGGHRPQRGDLVVATNPNNPSYSVCKRVTALEGDIVEVDPRRGDTSWSGSIREPAWGEGKFIKVPMGHVWLTGDNLNNSTDSRDYGPVPLATIRAKALRRVSGFRSISRTMTLMAGC